MIYLFYSNHLEALINPLSQFLRRSDPFVPASVTVPNRNLQMWLNFQLAKKLGIACNIRFQRLDEALLGLMASEGEGLLSHNMLRMMIIRQLSVYEKEDGEGLAHLKRYLSSSDETDARVRKFQLAGRLTDLFREYAFSRMEMTQAWEQDRAWFDEDHPLEIWQRRLWRDLFGETGLVARRNQTENRRPLSTLTALNLDGAELRRPLHVFGVSYISRFHQQALKSLSRKGDIYLYVLNPCRMFWEDLKTLKEARQTWTIPEEAFACGELDMPEENPFLQAWGKPGREYMRLLNDACDWDFQDVFVEVRENSLLNLMQSHILNRGAPPVEPLNLPPDFSLKVLGCPSPRREAEVVAGTIWALLLEDPNLTMRDIAVIVTDMGAYQTEIESAFKRMHDLRFNLVDGKTGRASRLIDAVLLLLELAESRFDRETVFRLYRHPNFQARFPNANPEDWLKIADDLAIFHGRSHQSQEAWLDKDLYNWDQGFKRMLLGAYIHEEDHPVFKSAVHEYLVYPMNESDSADAHLFYTLTQSLLVDTGDMPNLKLSAEAWSDYFRELMTTYLAPCDGEDADFERVCRAASGLAELGEALEQETDPIPYTYVKSFIVTELRKLTPFYGQYLADGVTVSSFMPMRPIPFKVIFIMGLDEGRFPNAASGDALDLRWVGQSSKTSNGATVFRERHIGDVTERERDRYMFLETVISARERLILSYTDRNEKTGDPLNPSSVLAETLYWTRRYCPDFEIYAHPLKSYSDQYAFMNLEEPSRFKSFDPFAARLAEVRRWRRDLVDHCGGRLPEEPELALSQNVQSFLGLGAPLFKDGSEGEDRIRLSLSQLRKFLECPLQETARRALRMRDDDEDLADKKNEPLVLDRLNQWSLLHRVMEQVLREHQGGFKSVDNLEDVLYKITRIAESDGVMPTGMLYDMARNHLMEALRGWTGALDQLGLQDSAQRFRLGRHIAESRYISGPITFELEIHGKSRIIEISGNTEFVFGGDRPHLISFVNKNVETKSKRWNKYLLRGFMDSVALAAAGLFDGVDATVVGSGGELDKTETYELSPQIALAYLKDLTRDMLQNSHHYLLPVDSVMKLREKIAEPDLQETYQSDMDALVGNDQSRCASSYGPLEDWRSYPAVEDVRSVLLRRFSLMFSSLKVPGWSIAQGDLK